MKVWLFGTYAWQGNPKALFLYMIKYCQETHECWWIADKEEDAKAIKKNTGIEQVTFMNSTKSKELFTNADVYVTENFRESYPIEMKADIKIFNTWHGVGLKHIELALIEDAIKLDYPWVNSVVRKNIKNCSLYRNNSTFLVTSQKMEEHFSKDAPIDINNIVKGVYPRNIIYKLFNIKTYDFKELLSKNNYDEIMLFAPTHRFGLVGVFGYLIPNLNKIEEICKRQNKLFIIKVHPMMKSDSYFLEMQNLFKDNHHILFWNDDYDIYEAFNYIDVAIVDYSSIFYDMLDAGVERFIRYIPDLEEYQKDLELIGDYMDLTEGVIANSFKEFLDILSSNDIPKISEYRKSYLNDYFFGYSKNDKEGVFQKIIVDFGLSKDTQESSIQKLINTVDSFNISKKNLKELHSFDVFDTLIRRSTLKPLSIFDYVRDKAKKSSIDFPIALLEDWVAIRNKVEHDVRDMMRKTTFERQSNKLEITLDDIYNRLQKHWLLTDEQTNFLKKTEIEAEINHVEPIKQRIDFLFQLKQSGHDVIMISDMYLPEQVIRSMLDRADIRLREIPLYLSSSIGYQKSTGKLYQYVFFDLDYQYKRWVHYGDNKHADGVVPRRYGIQTAVHDMDDFIPFESSLINAMDNYNRYPAYQLATKMQRYRSRWILSMDNHLMEQKYYYYTYVGSALVPYIHWVIKDAIKRDYKTLYFISRDGHFLKQIADKIIEIRKYPIQTRFIYGSRKAWRLPSFIDKVDEEMFGQFGNFVGMDGFTDLVKASYLDEVELLSLFPEFESLKDAKHLRGSIAENIRKIFSNSQTYRDKVLQLAKEKREVVSRYIKQEINPNEKFAFVEFWGRGYTQDTFSRLLNDAFNTEVDNPFYYVRSFTEDKETSIRHNFILTPQNFSFFEPIFAQTPYESISGYQENNGRIEPIIIPRETKISDLISEGIIAFTEDYLNLNTIDEDYFINALAKFTYQYQLTQNNDQFICNVFGELKDNISSFGEEKPYAPKLTLKQLQSIASKQELDKITHSIQISLAKSNEETIRYYNGMYVNYKLPKFNGNVLKKSYAINPLDIYVVNDKLPFFIKSIKNNSFYTNVSFVEATKRTDIYLEKDSCIKVVAVDWLKAGVPRLLTEHGYITANKDWVEKVETPQINEVLNNKDVSLAVASGQNPNEKQVQSSYLTNKKYKKFTRDPYGFFKDVKNPVLSQAKHLFDEKHELGKMMSRLVRGKLNK